MVIPNLTFQYYVGYSDSSGVLIPHASRDNDNFHQLCFSTSDEIVKISMILKYKPRSSTVKWNVSYCTPTTSIEKFFQMKFC